MRSGNLLFIEKILVGNGLSRDASAFGGRNQGIEREGMEVFASSFCKSNDFSGFDECGEAALTERFGEQVLYDAIGLEIAELAERAMKGGLIAGVVAFEAIEFPFAIRVEERVDA